MQPRYQIFVSSTFRDLKGERQAVLDAILQLRHFPAGMETFPAANSTPWEIIERVIGESDYYVLIIGGRYGSTDEGGIGYTEREYELAKHLGIPILPFLHSNPNIIPAGDSELEPSARAKLEAFRKKVEGNHHVKHWGSKEELRTNAIVSLSLAFTDLPGEGWVRASGVDNQELMSKLVALQQKYDDAIAENTSLKEKFNSTAALPDAAQGEDPIELVFSYIVGDEKQQTSSSLTLTWNQIFFALGEALMTPTTQATLENAFQNYLLKEFQATEKYSEVSKVNSDAGKPKREYVEFSSKTMAAILRQFLALDLISYENRPRRSRTVTTYNRQIADLVSQLSGGFETCWSLTVTGQRKFLERIVIKTRAKS